METSFNLKLKIRNLSIFLDNSIKKGLRTAEEYLYKPYINRLQEILPVLQEKAQTLFSFNGNFSGTGGRGLEVALYNV